MQCKIPCHDYISVPHFIVIHNSGIIEDYSLDPETSPPITNYAAFPEDIRHVCYLFEPEKMKLVVKYDGNPFPLEWYFDDEAPKELINQGDSNAREYSQCAVSQSTGKMIVYSGRSTCGNSKSFNPQFLLQTPILASL